MTFPNLERIARKHDGVFQTSATENNTLLLFGVSEIPAG